MDNIAILDRLQRIEDAIGRLLHQKAGKEWYTTAEVAEIVGKSDYTVREYCRKGQIKAEKSPNGRGWLVSHAELERLRNYGPLPERLSR
jgi:excisionase family DNA binding protein